MERMSAMLRFCLPLSMALRRLGTAMAAMASGLKADIMKSPDPLDILFLGGTGFFGPHQINHALARGHRVTMFNRGSNAGMYGAEVEELVGNRDANVDAGLSALHGDRRWDVVIDNSGYVPRRTPSWRTWRIQP